MFPLSDRMRLFLVLLLCIAASHVDGGGSLFSKVTQATYVYEKDQGPIPRPVIGALVKINKAGVVQATAMDKDVQNAAGQTPVQYVIALAAATEVGLPALVVQSGDTVVEVVKNPQTAEQVTEAVR